MHSTNPVITVSAIGQCCHHRHYVRDVKPLYIDSNHVEVLHRQKVLRKCERN